MDALLVETRRRSAQIDSYIDMIPARFYLGFEAEKVKGVYKTAGPGALDPAQARPTSELVRLEAAGAVSSTPGKKGKEKKKKKKDKETTSADASAAEGEGGARAELRRKLEDRIAELKEERRKRQSEADKARAPEQSARDKAKATARAVEQVTKVAGDNFDEGPKAAKRPRSDDVEAGRLDFAAQRKELPSEMDANKRGAKMAKIRQNVREEEKHKRRIAEAEAEGRKDDAEAMRQSRNMEKALLRAQGHKVHDELSKLRKSAKNVDRQHRRSSEKWTNRMDAEKDFQKQKQEKRKENLQKRANQKKKNKKRIGFEGKFGDSYINSQ